MKNMEDSECFMVWIFVICHIDRFSAISESNESGTNNAPNLLPIRPIKPFCPLIRLDD